MDVYQFTHLSRFDRDCQCHPCWLIHVFGGCGLWLRSGLRDAFRPRPYIPEQDHLIAYAFRKRPPCQPAVPNPAVATQAKSTSGYRRGYSTAAANVVHCPREPVERGCTSIGTLISPNTDVYLSCQASLWCIEQRLSLPCLYNCLQFQLDLVCGCPVMSFNSTRVVVHHLFPSKTCLHQFGSCGELTTSVPPFANHLAMLAAPRDLSMSVCPT